MSERWQNLPFLGSTRDSIPIPNRGGTDTHSQRQSGIGTNQSRTGTHYKKVVGIGTDQSGTGTDAFGSPDLCTLALLSPIFVHQ